MQKNRIFIFILVTICALLLSGCVSVVEEITLREDGSGTLRFALGVDSENYAAFQEAIPEGFEFENVFATLSREEGVTSVNFDRYEDDGQTWESVEMAIADFTVTFGEARRIGPITIEFDQQDGEYRFTQVMDVANSTLAIPGINLMDLSEASYLVNLTTPQIVWTNGVHPAAGVSTWSIPLDEVLQEGTTALLRADYVLEPYEGVFIPWEVFFPYVVIGFLALGGIAILVVILANTLGRQEKEPTLKF